jgi:hypothetical protein
MADDRVECFLLGARIHDHVGDMQWAVQEILEGKPGEVLLMDANKVLTDLVFETEKEVARAVADGCLPRGHPVEKQWEAVDIAASGPTTELAAALLTLGASLGDPPGTRNLRRARQLLGPGPSDIAGEKK